MTALPDEAIQILEDFARKHVLEGVRLFKTEDVFPDYEDRIEYFPELESRKLIVRDGASHGHVLEHVKTYRLMFRGVRLTSLRDPETLIVRNLWAILRGFRKAKRAEVDIQEVLAKAASLTLEDVGRGLAYAYYDMHLCSFGLSSEEAPYSTLGRVSLPMRLLEQGYRDFDVLLAELDKEVQPDPPVEMDESGLFADIPFLGSLSPRKVKAPEEVILRVGAKEVVVPRASAPVKLEPRLLDTLADLRKAQKEGCRFEPPKRERRKWAARISELRAKLMDGILIEGNEAEGWILKTPVRRLP